MSHGPDHSELMALHALKILPSSDTVLVETLLSSCPECQRELQSLRPAASTLASGPPELLSPSASVWERLSDRVSAETGDQPVPALRQAAPEWQDVAPGIACQLVATDLYRNRVTMLVRLAPGCDYPPHRHEGLEELYVLDGELIVDDKTFYPGDYRSAEGGTVDHRVWSATGCTCVLITSAGDVIL